MKEILVISIVLLVCISIIVLIIKKTYFYLEFKNKEISEKNWNSLIW